MQHIQNNQPTNPTTVTGKKGQNEPVQKKDEAAATTNNFKPNIKSKACNSPHQLNSSCLKTKKNSKKKLPVFLHKPPLPKAPKRCSPTPCAKPSWAHEFHWSRSTPPSEGSARAPFGGALPLGDRVRVCFRWEEVCFSRR